MSISIIRQPDDFQGAGNPVVLELGTDMYELTAPVAQVMEIDYGANTADVGDELEVIIGNVQFTMVCAAVPDDSGFEFAPFTNVVNFETDFITSLLNNYYINRYFTISTSLGLYKFTLTQRTGGEATKIEVVSWDQATPTQLTAPADATFNENFKLVCGINRQLDTSDPPEWNEIDVISAKPDADSKAIFELQHCFDGQFTPEIPEDPEETGLVQCPGLICNYNIELTEYYGATALKHKPWVIGSANAYSQVLKGGYRWEDFPGSDFEADYVDGTVNFLTNRPRARLQGIAQPDWLYFYVKEEETDLKLAVNVVYQDASDDQTTLYTVATSAKAMVYRVPCGYTQLGIAALNPSKVIKYWEVSISNAGGDPLTETMRFYADYRTYPREKYLLWENRWGAMEVLRCTGEFAEGKELEELEAIGLQDPDYTRATGNHGQYAPATQETVTLNTGILEKTWLPWLSELAESTLFYLAYDDEWQKLVVNNDALKDIQASNITAQGFTLPAKWANLNQV